MNRVLSKILLNNLLDFYSNNNQETLSKIMYKKIKARKMLRCAILSNHEKTGQKRKIPKIINFFKIINEYLDDIFFNHFRMTKSTFQVISYTNSVKKLCSSTFFQKTIKMLKSVWPYARTGRSGYSIEQCLYITIWKLCNESNFRDVGDRFGIGKGTAYKIFIKTIKSLSTLKTKVIKWPSTPSSQKQIMEGFENSRSHPFPSVLGCIDGMHVRIPALTKDAMSYYNRNGTHSVIVQGVVDSNFRFLDAFVGYPGRCHDASVWRDSPLKKAIDNGTINFPPECHLLGDFAIGTKFNGSIYK